MLVFTADGFAELVVVKTRASPNSWSILRLGTCKSLRSPLQGSVSMSIIGRMRLRYGRRVAVSRLSCEGDDISAIRCCVRSTGESNGV